MRVSLKSLLSLLFSLCLAIPLLNTPAHAQTIDNPSAVLMPAKDKTPEQDLVQKTLQALHSGDIQTKSKESDFKTSEITLGVTAAVAKIIVAMCGTSCAAAATGVGAAICAACITGIGGIGGISVTTIAHSTL